MKYPEWWEKATEFHVQQNDGAGSANNTYSTGRDTREPNVSGWRTVAVYEAGGHMYGKEYNAMRKRALDHMWNIRQQAIREAGTSGEAPTFRVLAVCLRLDVLR